MSSAAVHQDDVAIWNRRTDAVRAGRLVPALALLFAMTGCQLLETRETGQAGEPAHRPAPTEPELEPVRKPDLSTAMGYLETGAGGAARTVLATLAENAPESSVLISLLRQIDEPAEQLLPGPYREVEVGAGESLSLIAARELGDPLMFYALARLNGIEVPAQVPVGTMLRVPEAVETGRDRERGRPSMAVAEAPPETAVPEIESVADYLARSGQNDQARAMLIGKLDEGGGVESTSQLLARLTLARAAEMRAKGAFAPAVEVIDEALAVIGASGRRPELVEQRNEIRSTMLREEALRLRDQGELVEAYRTADRAASLDSTSDEAVLLADDLRATLVDSLHNEAMVAWRDRNVDLAIRAWESLLEVAPDFEPARVYMERARRLRERLGEP